MKFCSQLVNGRLYGKNTLGRTIAAVCACRHTVGVDYIIGKAEGLWSSVQRNRFVSGKSYGRRPVLAVSACVGQGVNVDCL